MLTYNVAGLLAEPAGAERRYRIEGARLEPGEELRQATPLRGTLRLSRTNRGLFIDGYFETAIQATCSRCLSDVQLPLELVIEEEALPRIELASGIPIDLRAEPDVTRLTDHHELELEPLLREAIQLAEPIAPLCRPDCPGLCPECGLELDGEPHDHPKEPLDPRLEVLRSFPLAGSADVEA